MRSSILCLALTGLMGIAQANPIANSISNPPVQTDPRGLITRGLSYMLFSREEATRSEPPPTKRQAATPPAPLTSSPAGGEGGGAVNNANRTVTLTVAQGDTLGQIARLFNSGICDIAKLNNIANPDFIEIGQVLQVPVNVANPDNDSCLKRGGAIPPQQNSTAPAPGGGEGGKKTRRRRSVNLSSHHGQRSP